MLEQKLCSRSRGSGILRRRKKRVEKRGDSKEGEPSENEAAIGFIRCPSDTERAWGYSNNRQFENIQFKTAGKRKKKLYKKENVIINHGIALKYIPIVIIM